MLEALHVMSATWDVRFVGECNEQKIYSKTPNNEFQHLPIYSCTQVYLSYLVEQKKNMGAATWLENKKHRHIHWLGFDKTHRIYKAEYKGFKMGSTHKQRIWIQNKVNRWNMLIAIILFFFFLNDFFFLIQL